MKKRTIGILAILAAAGASFFALARGAPPLQTAPVFTDTPSPIAAAPSQPCAYTWAYENLPDITAELQAAIQKILPEAEARATAFGEDCVAQDGSAAFGAMETDFYFIISVGDLADNETLGTLIEQALSVTDDFASPRVPGPQAGFVEFTFRTGTEQRVVRVPIPLGKRLREQGLRGAELLKAIETP
ncbi:MAG: hypothetical protein A3K45_00030 [Chloroflexi bacterium RIFOXYC12_FULL_59_14]|nr:MAG: hypothetical protein A3K45_00030 [Chloroflexi bacterium RIFOXYC12_FULL_59_14]